MNTNEIHYYKKALDFIAALGIETEHKILISESCFLPGLMIQQGKIVIDENGPQYPGDILHEAGHIAVVPSAERNELSGSTIAKRKDAPAEEMMAIAWSYAACIYLQIEPEFVFHNHGYRDGGTSIVENFKEGRFIGVPLLQWLQMTAAPGSTAPGYPHMIKWMRD